MRMWGHELRNEGGDGVRCSALGALAPPSEFQELYRRLFHSLHGAALGTPWLGPRQASVGLEGRIRRHRANYTVTSLVVASCVAWVSSPKSKGERNTFVV